MNKTPHYRKAGPGRKHRQGDGKKPRKVRFGESLRAAWAAARRDTMERARRG